MLLVLLLECHLFHNTNGYVCFWKPFKLIELLWLKVIHQTKPLNPNPWPIFKVTVGKVVIYNCEFSFPDDSLQLFIYPFKCYRHVQPNHNICLILYPQHLILFQDQMHYRGSRVITLFFADLDLFVCATGTTRPCSQWSCC